ncbi:MAG: hypothetical protein R3D84_09715 [Paracoccaceae bacterium]
MSRRPPRPRIATETRSPPDDNDAETPAAGLEPGHLGRRLRTPPEALVATGTPGALTAPPPRLVPLDPLLVEAAESRIEPADAAALAARAARLRATAASQ